MRSSSYEALILLDTKIREFHIPDHLQCPAHPSETSRTWSADLGKALDQHSTLMVHESSEFYRDGVQSYISLASDSDLLYIHRSYFVQAIRAEPLNPLGHKFGRSVLAAYTSALRLMHGIRGLYTAHRELTSRLWHLWSQDFSSCVSIIVGEGVHNCSSFADRAGNIGNREPGMLASAGRTDTAGRRRSVL